jgi:hypothetical protein
MLLRLFFKFGNALAFVALGTVFLGFKGASAVMAFTAKLPGVNFGHGNLDRSLFHLGEHFGVVTFLALDSGFGVFFTGESYLPHRAVAEFKGFACRHGHGSTGEYKKGGNKH